MKGMAVGPPSWEAPLLPTHSVLTAAPSFTEQATAPVATGCTTVATIVTGTVATTVIDRTWAVGISDSGCSPGS
jgi:hypothetical protein